MTSQEIDPIRICMGPACGSNWFYKREKDPNHQGTGNAGTDIEGVAKEIGLEVTVKSMYCQEMCPTGGSGLRGPTVFVGPDEKVVDRPSSYSDLREWLKNLLPKKS